jgi:hypothetical protein
MAAMAEIETKARGILRAIQKPPSALHPTRTRERKETGVLVLLLFFYLLNMKKL